MTPAADGPQRRRRALAGVVVILLLVTGCTEASQPRADGPDCGETPTRAGGGRWTCTFADDFRGKRLDPGKWVIQSTALSGFRNSQECYGNAANVVVGGGVLRLTARAEAAPFTCRDPSGHFVTSYTGGMVSTYRRFSQTYGRFEVRARMPDAKTRGLHSAMWLWPQDPATRGGQPASGEIDIGEFYTVYPDRVVPYVHYTPGSRDDPAVTNNDCLVADPSAWHTYVLEWTPKTIKISYDGAVCLVNSWNPAAPLTRPAQFDQPFFMVLTQAIGVSTTANQFDPLTTPLPATMQIDRVRAWR